MKNQFFLFLILSLLIAIKSSSQSTWPSLIRVGYFNSDNVKEDEIVIRYHADPSVTLAESSYWDARSLNCCTFLASRKGNVDFAIQTRPLYFDRDTVILKVATTSSGQFKLTFSSCNNFFQAKKITLLDDYLGIQKEIRADSVYNFTISQDPQSQGINRFKLVFVSGPIIIKSQPDITVTNTIGTNGRNVTFAPEFFTKCGSASATCSQLSGNVFNIGTTLVKVNVADTCGNADSCSFKVTVKDVEPPKFNCPDTLYFFADPSVCGHYYFPPSGMVADNNGHVNLTGLRDDGAVLSDPYFIGITTIFFTATDSSGNTAVFTQTIKVDDGTPPLIITPALDKKVECDGAGNISEFDQWLSNSGYAVVNDCSNVTWTHTIDSVFTGCGSNKSTRATFTAIDDNGNTVSTTATFSIKDEQPPLLTIPGDVVVAYNAGTSVSATGSATATDACGSTIITYTDDSTINPNPTPGNPYVLVINRTWKAADDCGNASTGIQVISVRPKTVLVACPGAMQFCQSASGNYTIPAIAAGNNPGMYTVSYTLTGATIRSGTGADASGVFKPGVTMIRWTIKDANGNTNTCTTTVTVNTVPVVSIDDASQDAFCSQLTLTASVPVAGGSYQWTYNNAVVGNSSSITLSNGSAEGDYKVVATVNGCTSQPAVYTYSAQNQLYRYTIVGLKNVKLGESNTVQSGNVGVMSYSGTADFKKNSSVAGPGAVVKSPYITVQNNTVNIPVKVYAPAILNLPQMQYYTGSYSSTDYTVAQNATVTLNNNYRYLTIKKGATVTLNGTTFKRIMMEEGAKVTFTATTLNMEELNIGKGPGNGYTVVKFADGTSVRVSKQVKIDDNCQVNTEGRRVTFYLGDSQCDEEKFMVGGSRTTVTANVYVPNGKLKVTGGDLYQCYLNGTFIAEEVKAEGKYITWNNNNNNCSLSKSSNNSAPQLITNEEIMAGIEVSVAPNPSASYFRISVKSAGTEHITIRITDGNGKLMQVIENQEVSTVFRVGERWINGTYYAEILQGKERKTLRLIKVN